MEHVLGHLSHAIEKRFKDQFVDQTHQVKERLAFAIHFVLGGRAGDQQLRILRPD